MASSDFAKTATETLTAYYRNITIFKNGSQVNFQNEPFIVNDRTYLPVREISELLGKNVTFNPQTYRIDIADTADANTIALQTKVAQQEVTIKNLEAQIVSLEAQLKSKTPTKTMKLDDLEDDLKDEYDEFEDLPIEGIVLSGDKDDIVVKIYVDLKKYQDEWDDIEDDIDDYLQDIVDDILDEFEDADIEGSIIDKSNKNKKLLGFTVSSKGKVVLGGTGSSKDSVADLEDDLNDEFSEYYADDVYFDFALDGDEDDLEVRIDADDEDGYYLDEDDLLDILDEDEIEEFLEDVYDYIVNIREFKDADIFGDISGIDFDFSDGSLDIEYQ